MNLVKNTNWMKPMTEKQAEALKKAQAAAREKHAKVNSKVSNCETVFDHAAAYADLSKRFDEVTLMCREILELLKKEDKKHDLSFLNKFNK